MKNVDGFDVLIIAILIAVMPLLFLSIGGVYYMFYRALTQ
jgi:hypothetical protein